ncbi:hypothetical protein [Echinicola soli]|nr:hypothetical protein [Echinicola soli]
MKIPAELIDKSDVAVPRYTSYPTLPFWEVPLYEIAAAHLTTE